MMKIIDRYKNLPQNKKILILATLVVLLALIFLAPTLFPQSNTKKDAKSSQESSQTSAQIQENQEEINLESIIKNLNKYTVSTYKRDNTPNQCPEFNLSEYTNFYKEYNGDSYFEDYSGKGNVFGEFFDKYDLKNREDVLFLERFKQNLQTGNVKELQFTEGCSNPSFSSYLVQKDINFQNFDSAKIFITSGQQAAPTTVDQIYLRVLLVGYSELKNYFIFSTSLNTGFFIKNEDTKSCRLKRAEGPTSYATGDYGFSKTTSDDYDLLDLNCILNDGNFKEKLEDSFDSILSRISTEFFN